MSVGTLYASAAEAKRILAVAAFAGLSVNVKEPKADLIKTPTLETADGFSVFESSAIDRYLASLAPNSTLIGSNAKEAALVDQWVAFSDAYVTAYNNFIIRLVQGHISPYNKLIHTNVQDRLVGSLTTLEKHLATRTYLATERITLADITLASAIQSAVATTVDASLRTKLPNVLRHFETIAAQYTPPAKEKKEKKEEAPKPKAEKKKPKKAEEEDEDDDDKPIEEPKAKNPLDSLPKSTLNLEDWKRAYSNKDTRGAGGSLEWLYEHFDKEGYSLWRVDFKYNDELTQTFMSSNLIGGFFNRLEASRKYLFGSMGVLGETNNSIITGALIARGQEIKPNVDCAPDWESYSYQRIDLANEEQKKFFEGALAWDLEIDGKKWVDGKNFK
ncbi:hypothetical protein EW146_g7709 [Bondarzewia mesenterica]|uniref:Elongation factor 1-gamma n=1 Tax=Bondarzewia mesenterica TaxID=1095465 RepID=A0A4S4LLU5_9AGAM|nr:hypothetical protein EW146_g7709 [Bondarzewia mesenterica]